MGLSYRMFLLDQNDRLYRLANTKFAQMLRDPAKYRFPQFAGQRTRVADAIVELVGREPSRVIQITFDILTFDDDGYLDQRLFGEQQIARAEVMMRRLMVVPERDTNIVDAARRFIAQGSHWAPSSALERTIHDAALGKIKCQRM